MTPHDSPLSRRQLLQTAAAGIAGMGVASVIRLPGGKPAQLVTPVAQAAGCEPALEPVSLAMHLHGSFSEGIGSMEGHLSQAEQLGVDVLFWTDHDFRVSAQGYRQTVNFDGWTEQENGVDWTWSKSTTGTLVTDTVSWEQWNRGSVALLTATANTSTFSTMWLEGQPWNSTYRTNMTDTTIEVDVFPEELGDDARLVVEVLASHHPAGASRPAGQPLIAYRIGPYSAVTRSASGLYGRVELPAPSWQWTTLTLDPVADIAAMWPDLVAQDNSLYRLRIGVETRNGATAKYALERLSFNRTRRTGNLSVDMLREVMGYYTQRFPAQRQYESLEVSLVRHLNWFGGNVTMPQYPNPPFKDNSEQAAADMVDFIHANGGLACYNHPLFDTKEVVAQHFVNTSALGTDIAEVGTGADPSAMLYVFDSCARNTVFITANGVSDDHEGTDWLGRNANWITKVWSPAASVELPDLTASLGAGKAWFYRPNGWSGELDLQLNGTPAMGGALVTGASSTDLSVHATALPSNGTLEIVTGLADHAAAQPAITSQSVPASAVVGGFYNLTVDTSASKYVRVAVRDPGGAIVGLSNPVWLLRSEPPAGIPADRRLSV